MKNSHQCYAQQFNTISFIERKNNPHTLSETVRHPRSSAKGLIRQIRATFVNAPTVALSPCHRSYLHGS